jgi:hypothetical protein
MFRHAMLILALSTTAISTTALAQGSREERAACRRDMLRHCRNMGNDQDRVRDCLIQHRNRLSPRCRRALEVHGY